MKNLCVLLLFVAATLSAQTQKQQTLEEAEEFFKLENYLSAIPIYTKELKKNTDDAAIRYKLGICYLNSRLNRKLAITYLEEASKHPKANEEVWVFLGRAYHLEGRIDEAVACFRKFATLKPKRANEVEHYLEQCKNAVEFMRNPVQVSFMNLGPEINGPDPDYYPYVDKDETMMVFTSRRKENIGGRKPEVDGYRSSDIYLSNTLDGKWSIAQNAGRAVNGSLDEHSVGLSWDGLELYMYMDHIENFGDVYCAKRPDAPSGFLKPKLFDGNVNTGIETAACMSQDGNALFFVRKDRLKGSTDLYLAKKLPDGKWAQPIKLPENINSIYNEDMPYLSYDGLTLYFTSEGHTSMGGFDIFKTQWDPSTNTFANPVNLGFPINTPDDDRSFCITRNNKYAYVAAFRPSGLGDLDIYRITFLNEESESVIFAGKIAFSDSSTFTKNTTFDVSITVTDTKSDAEYLFVPNASTGKYIMALPAGSYRLVTYCKGYARYKEEFTVSDVGKSAQELRKDIVLRKLKKKTE
jgi:Tetratricopeptide repeat/WD40-like Beta Propeller Repeat